MPMDLIEYDATFILQETLLNLLLRNYLQYNLYDQAEKLRAKTQRLESHSNQQVSVGVNLFRDSPQYID